MKVSTILFALPLCACGVTYNSIPSGTIVTESMHKPYFEHLKRTAEQDLKCTDISYEALDTIIVAKDEFITQQAPVAASGCGNRIVYVKDAQGKLDNDNWIVQPEVVPEGGLEQ